MMNKRGQDLSIGTLILIVLGIIVLVLLILGFSMGWGNLWEKINIFSGGGSSIESKITTCSTAVIQGETGKYTFCEKFDEMKIDGKTEYLSCEDPRVLNSLSDRIDCTDKDYAKLKCESLKESKGDKFDPKIKVNSVTCEDRGITN